MQQMMTLTAFQKPTPMTKTPARSDNRFAFMTVTALFFMWGFISCMNDLLQPNQGRWNVSRMLTWFGQ
jgi:hypothetical protein